MLFTPHETQQVKEGIINEIGHLMVQYGLGRDKPKEPKKKTLTVQE